MSYECPNRGSLERSAASGTAHFDEHSGGRVGLSAARDPPRLLRASARAVADREGRGVASAILLFGASGGLPRPILHGRDGQLLPSGIEGAIEAADGAPDRVVWVNSCASSRPTRGEAVGYRW